MKKFTMCLLLGFIMTVCILLSSCVIGSDNGAYNRPSNNTPGNSNNNGNGSNTNSGESYEEHDQYFIYSGSSVRAYNTSISGDVVIPSQYKGVTIDTIPKDAFKGCKGITLIEVPDTVTTIEEGAFNGCISLKSISLPFVGKEKGITNNEDGEASFGYIFGGNSYEGGTKIMQCYNSNKPFGSYTDYNYFYVPSGLRSVTIRNESILGYGAFYNCDMLTSINLNDGISMVGEASFYNCSKIKEINLPGITAIPLAMMSECDSLEKFTIGDSVESIGPSAFNKCTNLSSVSSDVPGEYFIPDNVLSVGPGAFNGCISLKSISLPFVGKEKGITNNKDGEASFGYIFGSNSYEGGTEIKQYYMDYNMFSYNYNTFYVPSGLRNVTVRNESILGYGAFYNCDIITSLIINSGAQNTMGDNVFYNCIEPVWD